MFVLRGRKPGLCREAAPGSGGGKEEGKSKELVKIATGGSVNWLEEWGSAGLWGKERDVGGGGVY